MYLARDKNNHLYLFPYGKPHRGVKTGMFYANINPEIEIKVKELAYKSFSICNLCVRIFETDDRYKDITWENSPIELTFKL